MLYGKIGEQTVVSYVYLKVFPPFFIQVVSIFEELVLVALVEDVPVPPRIPLVLLCVGGKNSM